MSIQSVLLPLFAHVLLTFVLLLHLGRMRVGYVKRGDVRVRDIALGESNWPPRAMQASNAFANQFQLPVLFYVLTTLAWITRQADLIFVVMAWMFVLLRVAHAAIHVTGNRVSLRFAAYAAGLAILMLMWGIFAVRILLAAA